MWTQERRTFKVLKESHTKNYVFSELFNQMYGKSKENLDEVSEG